MLTDFAYDVVEGAADVDYQPFGLPRPGSPALPANVTRRYTGQEWDASTALYNYNARLYNPILGMFITPDSLIPDLYDPQSLNRYAYVRNNPMIYVDPSGHADKQTSKSNVFSVNQFLSDVKQDLLDCGGVIETAMTESGTSDFLAGVGDSLTLGATELIREATNIDKVIDTNSTAYTAGEAAGTVGSVAKQARH